MTAAPSFSWAAGAFHAEVVLGLCLLASAYLAAWIPRARRGPRVPASRPLLFFAGLAALLAASSGPLHDLSDTYLVSAHMVQHLVLTLLAPPLLLAGTPAWMLDRILDPVLAGRLTGPLTRALLRPLPQFAVYAVALIAWHLPGPFTAALERHGWHAVEHLTLIGAAILAWWPIVSSSRRAPALPYAAQILYLFVFGMPMTVVAAMVTAADEVLYPFYAAAPRVFDLSPLADQRLGGVLMWVPAGVIPLVAFTIVFFRWAAAEADEPA